MAVWGQTVIWQGPAAVLHGFDRVRILFHPLDPGYYAVFARLMVAPHGGTVEWEHAAYVQMTLGSATDETYGRLVVGGFSDDLVKASTPVSLMTVGESNDTGRGGVDLIARGSGALIVEARLNIISLDEIKAPGEHEGSFPLSDEDSPALHVHDYSRDIYIPARGARTEREGG